MDDLKPNHKRGDKVKIYFGPIRATVVDRKSYKFDTGEFSFIGTHSGTYSIDIVGYVPSIKKYLVARRVGSKGNSILYPCSSNPQSPITIFLVEQKEVDTQWERELERIELLRIVSKEIKEQLDPKNSILSWL